jgi:hypothetical protein
LEDFDLPDSAIPISARTIDRGEIDAKLDTIVLFAFLYP